MEADLALGIGLGLTAILAAFGGLFLMSAVQPAAVTPRFSIFDETQKGTLFLFDGETLIDCTPGGRAVLAASSVPGTAWIKLMAYLSTPFPQIQDHLSRLPVEGAITLAAEDADGLPLLLQAEYRGGLSRILLIDAESEGKIGVSDPLVHRSMTEELRFLRSVLSHAPVLAWREKDNGAVVWANTPYLLLAGELLPPGQDLTWPLPRLFGRTAIQQGAANQRQKLLLPEGVIWWYDLVSVPDADGHRVYALRADAAVHAETTLRDFMQTLTKTFAHLPIGLAIFDSQRHLQMFNPALLDLTGLPPDFLSTRPSLLAVLDALRERSMVPEPKDYRGWRKQITDLERASVLGTYEETWNLPSGETYKVIGRPHPNGALALMIHDISSEITRTRRYRADLELGQSVIDSMDEAVAVFSESSLLVMTNAAYKQMWGHDPDEVLAGGTIASLARHWRSRTAPSTLWADAEDFVSTVGDRTSWMAEARLTDGRLIACRFAPLAGGATLIGFRPTVPQSAPDRRSA